MLAQVSLIPSESKKLIAKAIARMDVVKQAVERGTVVIHPSSSTYFIIEELVGQKPQTDHWVCGVVMPKGTCVEMGILTRAQATVAHTKRTEHPSTAFPWSWAINSGKFSSGIPLGTLLERMNSEDIYIKGVNAIDPYGNVGVLWGQTKGGVLGLVMAFQRKRGFRIIFPVGLEKLIPVRIKEAAKQAKRQHYDYSMGLPCGLLPCDGLVVTEREAIKALSGATAIPIAAGGLGGAEGAVTLVLKGDEKQVTKAINYIEQSKGARLPQVRSHSCYDCPLQICTFPLKDKPWV